MPRDKISGEHQGYAFIEMKTAQDAKYTIDLL